MIRKKKNKCCGIVTNYSGKIKIYQSVSRISKSVKLKYAFVAIICKIWKNLYTTAIVKPNMIAEKISKKSSETARNQFNKFFHFRTIKVLQNDSANLTLFMIEIIDSF